MFGCLFLGGDDESTAEADAEAVAGIAVEAAEVCADSTSCRELFVVSAWKTSALNSRLSWRSNKIKNKFINQEPRRYSMM